MRRRRKDPPFDPAEVQSGILTAQGSRDTPMAGGALLLMTIADASAARTFLAGLRLDYPELGDTTFFHLGDNKREQAIAEWFRRIGKK